MTDQLTYSILRELLAKEYPFRAESALDEQAHGIHETLDPHLRELLYLYYKNNETGDYRFHEFTVLKIMALCRPCSYFQAVLLMDEYIRDPAAGRLRILRRNSR